jgi:hypothetical protein
MNAWEICNALLMFARMTSRRTGVEYPVAQTDVSLFEKKKEGRGIQRAGY